MGGRHALLRATDDIVDLPHDLAQEIEIPIGRRDHPLPVPLVDVDRVQLIQHLVGADGVHVGVDALAGREAVVGQGHPLPLGQRLHALRAAVVQALDREGNRPLDAVEVVIDARVGQHE